MHQTATVRAGAPPYEGVELGKFAMWLFLASEVMFFTGLIGAYIVLRNASPDWPDPTQELNIPLTALNTFLLICSSVTMVRALYAAMNHDASGFRTNLLATIIVGSIFLGVQAYEWNALLHHGLTPQGSLFGATFYTLTGFHGLHVLGGVITLVILFLRSQSGRANYVDGHYHAVEYAGLYWHFVDLVWILLFTIVYLI
jgi:heme/copper-type cytochrome/quinol oxidase subunit 3